MSTPPVNPLMPVLPSPTLVDPDLAPLLTEPFAHAWSPNGPSDAAFGAIRNRLTGRLAASRQAEAVMCTTRRERAPRELVAPGVTGQTLYRSKPGAVLRPGEPLRVRLIELSPGASFDADTASKDLHCSALHREWLVVDGSARLNTEWLSRRDYHASPAGSHPNRWSSDSGALLFLREAALPCAAGEVPVTVRDAEAGWPDFAPGIQRRVLWQRGTQAALLYFAQPGAQVPEHTHEHDEECLMVQGELFLDDMLLRQGDYQLAPAGTGHRITATDTGVVIYAHGDSNLQFVG